VRGGNPRFAEEIMQSLIAVRLEMGGPVIGSGILVDIDGSPYMMTALHVVDHMIRQGVPVIEVACRVDTYTETEDCANINIGGEFSDQIMTNRSLDAALVPLSRFPEGSTPAREVITDYKFRIGQRVWVIGCPLGNPNIVTRGIVSGRVHGNPPRLFTDSDTWFGGSGGGVFLATGEFVGFIHSMVGSRTPGGAEVAEGLNVFSPLPGWGFGTDDREGS